LPFEPDGRCIIQRHRTGTLRPHRIPGYQSRAIPLGKRLEPGWCNGHAAAQPAVAEAAMTTAAIYARKSTDQSDTADDQRSVARQIANARAFAQARGWTVDERHVYVDDGVSGAASLTRLRAKARLLDVIKNSKRPPFQVLVVQAPDRLSRRDGDEAVAEMKAIAQAGVEIWFYADGTRFEYGTFQSNTLGFLKSEFAAEFRRAIAAKTYEAMVRKAKAGLVTGGKVFGYDNERIRKGEARHRINEAESEVVRRIFEHYAAGKGYRTIAHMLNEQGTPCPRAQRGRSDGWDQGTIRDVLYRSIYRGRLEWNKTKKRDKSGDQKITKRDPRELIVVDADHLRILSHELIEAVDTRLAERKRNYAASTKGQLVGKATHGRFLLTGLLKCPSCGGGFEAQRTAHGRTPGSVYVCTTNRRKGPRVCPNKLALPIEDTELRVLNVIEREVLVPAFIDHVVDSVFVPPDVDRAALEEEARLLDQESANLTAAVKRGGDIPTLVDELREATRRRSDINRRLAPQEHLDRAELRAALEQRVEDWRQVLRKYPQQGRQVLKALVGEIWLWVGTAEDLAIADAAMPSDNRGTDNITAADCGWVASVQVPGMLIGLPGFPGLDQRLASPAGFEPAFWP
jgi:site-specific DNA recombinase